MFPAQWLWAGSELSISLSPDVVVLDYGHSSGNKGTRWGFGGLYNDPKRGSAVSASFNVVGTAGTSKALHTGLGFKAVVHDTFQTATSLGLGGSLAYVPASWSGLGLEGQAYYAPSMLNTNDADQYFEFLARLTYNVNQQAKVFVGYNKVRVDYDDAPVDHVNLDKTFNLGFALRF